MCAPALGAVVGMMGAAASFAGQQADYRAKKAAWEQNVVNAEAGARDGYRQTTVRFIQEQEKTTQAKHVSYLQEAEKASQAENSAGAAGISGISVDNILRDISGKSELNRTYDDMNYKYVAADLTEQLHQIDTKEMNQINSMPVPQAPSPLTMFAGMAGAGVKAMGGMGLM